METINCRIPMRTYSEANQRIHWGERATRARRQLDDDNLRGATKFVRDGIADALGIDDGDPRIEWRYGQAVDKEYAVVVTVGTEQGGGDE